MMSAYMHLLALTITTTHIFIGTQESSKILWNFDRRIESFSKFLPLKTSLYKNWGPYCCFQMKKRHVLYTTEFLNYFIALVFNPKISMPQRYLKISVRVRYFLKKWQMCIKSLNVIFRNFTLSVSKLNHNWYASGLTGSFTHLPHITRRPWRPFQRSFDSWRPWQPVCYYMPSV